MARELYIRALTSGKASDDFALIVDEYAEWVAEASFKLARIFLQAQAVERANTDEEIS